jgi:hypothetical protein
MLGSLREEDMEKRRLPDASTKLARSHAKKLPEDSREMSMTRKPARKSNIEQIRRAMAEHSLSFVDAQTKQILMRRSSRRGVE